MHVLVAREGVDELGVAAEVREVESGARDLNVLLSLCTAVEPAWLQELFPGLTKQDVYRLVRSAKRRLMNTPFVQGLRSDLP